MVVISSGSSISMQPHRLADQVVLDLVDRLGRLGPRVADPDRRLESPVDRHIHMLIDRRAQDGAEFVAVEGGQVGAPAREADTIGGLRDDHVKCTYPVSCPNIPASYQDKKAFGRRPGSASLGRAVAEMHVWGVSSRNVAAIGEKL